MTTVKFYIFIDDYSNYETMTNNIVERFQMDYTETEFNIDLNEDEELLSITFNVDTENIEDIDTFLCEEICQEHEVYCKISSENSEDTKNYYFDEEEEWIYK